MPIQKTFSPEQITLLNKAREIERQFVAAVEQPLYQAALSGDASAFAALTKDLQVKGFPGFELHGTLDLPGFVSGYTISLRRGLCQALEALIESDLSVSGFFSRTSEKGIKDTSFDSSNYSKREVYARNIYKDPANQAAQSAGEKLAKEHGVELALLAAEAVGYTSPTLQVAFAKAQLYPPPSF